MDEEENSLWSDVKIPTKPLTSIELLRERMNRFAKASGYVTRWTDKISVGDLYMVAARKPPHTLHIYTAGIVNDLSRTIEPTDIWGARYAFSECVRLVPLPKPDELTINEKLDRVIQEIEALNGKVDQLLKAKNNVR